MSQTTQQPGISVMDKQISGDNINSGDLSISPQFRMMRSKMEHKRKDLDKF